MRHRKLQGSRLAVPESLIWSRKKKHGTYFKRGKRTAAKLTDDQAKEIRRLHKAGGVTYKELGKKFSVDPTTCWHVVTRVTYSHIP
jgi:DNA invertase Pin-like site-specific DNA recombinase